MDLSDFRVRYRDSAGVVQETDLAMTKAGEVAAGSPWRVFRWHRGQRHYSGWYWSSTMGSHVVYESRLELARLLLADSDPRVVSIASQPFHLSARADGRIRSHVPDFLLVDRDQLVTVVNVKPAELVNKPAVVEAFDWAGKVFAERGWRHEVWSGAPEVVLANVRFLAAYRYRDRVTAEVVARVEEAVTEPVSLRDLESVRPGERGEVRSAVLHLLWRGRLRADLSTPLSDSTVVERGA